MNIDLNGTKGCVPNKRDMVRNANNHSPLAGLTDGQRLGLSQVLNEVRQKGTWSWTLPVLLRERCWLRLTRIQLCQLQRHLPPNGRDEAPELMHYRLLVAEGLDPFIAQQTCWQDFGAEDCQRALQDYWQSKTISDHGWTSKRYRQLVSLYRDSIEEGIATVPMLVLARKQSEEQHQLHWITDSTPTMRHTCA